MGNIWTGDDQQKEGDGDFKCQLEVNFLLFQNKTQTGLGLTSCSIYVQTSCKDQETGNKDKFGGLDVAC